MKEYKIMLERYGALCREIFLGNTLDHADQVVKNYLPTNYQIFSRVEPSLNSASPTLYFPLVNLSEHFRPNR